VPAPSTASPCRSSCRDGRALGSSRESHVVDPGWRASGAVVHVGWELSTATSTAARQGATHGVLGPDERGARARVRHDVGQGTGARRAGRDDGSAGPRGGMGRQDRVARRLARPRAAAPRPLIVERAQMSGRAGANVRSSGRKCRSSGRNCRVERGQMSAACREEFEHTFGIRFIRRKRVATYLPTGWPDHPMLSVVASSVVSRQHGPGSTTPHTLRMAQGLQQIVPRPSTTHWR
jgi:hypothetical protein